MNVSDSERLATILEQLGFQPTAIEAEADLIGVIACSVRQTAIDRIYGQAVKWKKWKQQRQLVTMLSGCVLPLDQPKLAPLFDLLVPTRQIHHLPPLLADKFSDLQPLTAKLEEYFDITPKYSSLTTAFVPISFGCNNFCSYCAVPFTRGREISRPFEKIMDEIRHLLERNVKEIVLLGQNVNSYGLDHLTVRSLEQTRATVDQAYAQARRAGKKAFPDLLRAVAELPGNYWVRFLTSNPQDMSDEVIDTVAAHSKIEPFFHLPIQAGNDEILKRMNRRYTVASYFEVLGRVKAKIPLANVTTDVIVGFPGETDQQFQDTVKAFKRGQYTQAFIGKYSPRPGTLSAQMFKDDIPWAEKKRREKVINQIITKSALEYNRAQVGQIAEVLVENFDGQFNYGYTKYFQRIRFPSPDSFQGQFVKVTITTVEPWSLAGQLVK